MEPERSESGDREKITIKRAVQESAQRVQSERDKVTDLLDKATGSVKELAARYRRLLEMTPDYSNHIARLRVNTQNLRLDPDPSSIPLSRINGHIQKIQGYMNRATVIETEAIANLLLWKTLANDVRQEEEDCIALASLHPDLKALSNQTLRDHAARRMLPNGLKHLRREVEGQLNVAVGFERSVKSFKENLAHAYEAVSRQITVIQTQVELGEIARSYERGPTVRVRDRNEQSKNEPHPEEQDED